MGEQIEAALAEHAEVIRAASRATVESILEIGRHLTEAKKLCGHGEWLPWLKREFGWDERTARRFMSIHELAGKSGNLSYLSIGVSALYLLAAPSTPEAARQKVFRMAESGPVSYRQTQSTVAKHKEATSAPPVQRDRGPRPVINWDQVNAAMKLIREMDHDTWDRFDKNYRQAKEAGDIGTVAF